MGSHGPESPVASSPEPSTRMLRRAWLWLWLVVGAALLVGGAAALQELRYQASPRGQAEAYHEVVRESRAEVETCFQDLERTEAHFRAQERLTNELRSRIDRFESMDPRGVPADQYEDYLEVFERYNASLPAWELRAESLRLTSERCRGMAEAHNERADSLRGLMEEAGLWTPPPRSPLDEPADGGVVSAEPAPEDGGA
jgi:hypothetical protein